MTSGLPSSSRPSRSCFLLALLVLSAPVLPAAPLALTGADPVNRADGTISIRITAESGVQYFVRSTTDLAGG